MRQANVSLIQYIRVVDSNSEILHDNLNNRLGLPFFWNFPDMRRISVLNFVSGNSFEEYCTLIPGISTGSEDLVTRSSDSYYQWGSGKKKHAILYCIVFRLCSTVTILWYFSSVVMMLFSDGLVVASTYWKVVKNFSIQWLHNLVLYSFSIKKQVRKKFCTFL